MLYVQCQLSKGSMKTTAWLPQKFAKVGKALKIKGKDGWVVKSCGVKLEEKEALERSQDYKHQRKASDI